MNKYLGSSLGSLFEEQGSFEEVTRRAIKKGLVETVRERLEELELSKSDLAKQLGTSRSHLDRLLDPDETNTTLAMLVKLARALRLDARFELTEPAESIAAPQLMRRVLDLQTFQAGSYSGSDSITVRAYEDQVTAA